jgi:hypothetical protein
MQSLGKMTLRGSSKLACSALRSTGLLRPSWIYTVENLVRMNGLLYVARHVEVGMRMADTGNRCGGEEGKIQALG